METLTMRDRAVFVLLAAGTVGISLVSTSTLVF